MEKNLETINSGSLCLNMAHGLSHEEANQRICYTCTCLISSSPLHSMVCDFLSATLNTKLLKLSSEFCIDTKLFF